MSDDAHAQAHITALGDLIEATAQKAPAEIRHELRAAGRAFARAQRFRIQAEDRAANDLRRATRDIAFTVSGPDGSALAALVAAMLWAAILAGRWHEAKGHTHQADAARATVQHLQAAADQALAPVLTARRPGEAVHRTLAHDVRAATEADRILADTGWPALAALLSDAETRGHQPHQLLSEAAAQRELATARQPARVLLTRIQHTARNPVPNRRAEAARLRSSTARGAGRQPSVAQPTTAPAPLPNRPRR